MIPYRISRKFLEIEHLSRACVLSGHMDGIRAFCQKDCGYYRMGLGTRASANKGMIRAKLDVVRSDITMVNEKGNDSA